MRLSKVKQYGKHERDRLLEEGEIMKLRREITNGEDWQAVGTKLYIGEGFIECNTAERAQLIALLRNSVLQISNDNMLLRRKLDESKRSYKNLMQSFRNLWEKTQNGK